MTDTVRASQGCPATADGTRKELAFGTDIPDARTKADHKTGSAKQQRRHLHADFGPTAQGFKRSDQEHIERIEWVLTQHRKQNRTE